MGLYQEWQVENSGISCIIENKILVEYTEEEKYCNSETGI